MGCSNAFCKLKLIVVYKTDWEVKTDEVGFSFLHILVYVNLIGIRTRRN